jgi:hypothetical protein
MDRACALAVFLIAVAAAGDASAECTISGHATLSKVTVKTATETFELGVTKASADVTVTGRGTTIAVTDAIAFTGTVTQQLWLAVKNHYVDGQITFEHGSDIMVERADADMVFGRAVLHASDVMEGEAKDPDESAGVAHVPCDDVSVEWFEHTDAKVAGAGIYYFARSGNRLVLHREAKDGAPGIEVSQPNCEGSCVFFEEIAKKPGWIELAAVNEGVAAVGWVRTGSVKRVPDGEGVGYTYGCDGSHDFGGNVFRMFAPNQKEHTVQIAVGTGLFTAPRGDAWAVVKQTATFRVVYAPGETWAEVVWIPNINLRAANVYVPVASLTEVKP